MSGWFLSALRFEFQLRWFDFWIKRNFLISIQLKILFWARTQSGVRQLVSDHNKTLFITQIFNSQSLSGEERNPNFPVKAESGVTVPRCHWSSHLSVKVKSNARPFRLAVLLSCWGRVAGGGRSSVVVSFEADSSLRTSLNVSPYTRGGHASL